MTFVSGPRQVGKTTTCRRHADAYCNWDNLDDRELVLAGPVRLAAGGRGLERHGLGRFDLGYLRDKEKREVDCVFARDGAPWFRAEVKHRETTLSPVLAHYQQQVGAPFAFQVVVDADYVDADYFAAPGSPLVVPARTLLSQLL